MVQVQVTIVKNMLGVPFRSYGIRVPVKILMEKIWDPFSFTVRLQVLVPIYWYYRYVRILHLCDVFVLVLVRSTRTNLGGRDRAACSISFCVWKAITKLQVTRTIRVLRVPGSSAEYKRIFLIRLHRGMCKLIF
jgi:hypothetical protein